MSGSLTRALQLSQQMLAAAQIQVWDIVAALNDQRDPLLLGAHAPDDATRAQLAQILECNRELGALVALARDEAASQCQRERARGQAVAAYAQA